MSSQKSTTYFTPFNLSHSDTQGQAQNSVYPYRREINHIDIFKKVTSQDHTVGKFRDDVRSKKGFICADVICMDVDNDDKIRPKSWDNPDDWMTTSRFQNYFSDYTHIISTSKSHKKEKGGRSKRDRFHVYFPLGHTIDTKEEYGEIVQYLCLLFQRDDGISWFDTNATDCARFFYGHKGLRDILVNEGKSSILDWVSDNKNKVSTKIKHQDKDNKNKVVMSLSKSDEAKRIRFKNGWKYKDIIKKLPVEGFYGELEVEQETDTYWKVHCQTGKHDDKNASMTIDKETFSWNCFAGCGGGNVFECISIRDDIGVSEVVQEYCDDLGIRNKEKQVQVEVIDPTEEKEIEETPADRAVKELNKSHALITIGGKTRIMKWTTTSRNINESMMKRPDLEFMSKDDFLTLYSNKTVPVGEKNVNVAAVWLHHPHRRQYDGIDFDPSTTEPSKEGGMWNMWEDWDTGKIGFDRFIDEEKYNKIKDDKDALSGCQSYIELIKEVICGNYEEKDKDKLLRYILYWMADAVVNPTKRTGTAIALKSGQGTGKSFFIKCFGELFGNYFTHIQDSKRLEQNFNWYMKDNLLLYSDEAFFAGDKKQAGLMKGLITEGTRMLESKYINAVEVNNFTRLILSSNDEWIIPSDVDDRRWMVIDVSAKRKNDRPYFTHVRAEWDNGGKESFLYFLRNTIAKQPDFNTFNFIGERLITEAHWLQKIQSNKTAQWWVDVLERGYFQFKNDMGSNEKILLKETEQNQITHIDKIHEDYISFEKRHGNTRYLNTQQNLSRELNKLGIGFNKVRTMVDGSKRTVWIFPSIEEMRHQWEMKTGNKIWSELKDLDIPVIEQIEKLLPESTQDEDTIPDDTWEKLKIELESKRKKKYKI